MAFVIVSRGLTRCASDVCVKDMLLLLCMTEWSLSAIGMIQVMFPTKVIIDAGKSAI